MKTLLLLAAALAGRYELSGVSETASELMLRPDGTFSFALIYGAADYQSEGKWTEEKGAVILQTSGQAEPPFKLLKSEASKTQGTRVRVVAPSGRGVPNLAVMISSSKGQAKARTDQDGVAEFEAAGARSVGIAIRVYNVEWGPSETNPQHNEFTYEINAKSITTLRFDRQILTVEGSALLMRRDPNTQPMRYVKR